jgi:hypothetical protein
VLHRRQSVPSPWTEYRPESLGPGDGQGEGFVELIADAGVPQCQLTGPIGLKAGENDEQGRRSRRPVVEPTRPSWRAGLEEGTE